MPPIKSIAAIILILFAGVSFNACSSLPKFDNDPYGVIEKMESEENKSEKMAGSVDPADAQEETPEGETMASVADPADAQEETPEVIEEKMMADSSIENVARGGSEMDQGEIDNTVELAEEPEPPVVTLEVYQEAIDGLETRIRELQEQVERNSTIIPEQMDFLNPKIDELRNQIAGIEEQLAQNKKDHAGSGKMHDSADAPDHFKKAYKEALAYYWNHHFDKLVIAMENFVDQNPPASYKEKALYWMGIGFASLEMYDDAIEHFKRVIDNYPKGTKVHDSMHMLGVCYVQKGGKILKSALAHKPPAKIRKKIRQLLIAIQ